MKLITFSDVCNASIDPAHCIQWVSDAIAHKDTTILPPKVSLHPGPEGVFCNFIPSIVPDNDGRMWGGVKLVTRYPDREPVLDSSLLLFDASTGEMLALMDADWITAMRTGAVAAHSICLLAKDGFSQVSMMGLGNAGRATMLMLAEAVKDRKLNVRILKHKGQEHSFMDRFAGYDNLSFECVDSYDDLVEGAEVVVSAVTYLADDICDDTLFSEGVLVVPVHTRGFTNCDLFFDKVFADDEGHVCHFKNFGKFKSFAEVSDVVNGRAPGRESDKERILAYNIGVSMHDVFFGAMIYRSIDHDCLQDISLEKPTEKHWI